PGRVVEAPPGSPRLSLGALVAVVVQDESARLCRYPNGLVGHEPRAEPLLEHVGAAGGRLHAMLLQAGSQLLQPGACFPPRPPPPSRARRPPSSARRAPGRRRRPRP